MSTVLLWITNLNLLSKLLFGRVHNKGLSCSQCNFKQHWFWGLEKTKSLLFHHSQKLQHFIQFEFQKHLVLRTNMIILIYDVFRIYGYFSYTTWFRHWTDALECYSENFLPVQYHKWRHNLLFYNINVMLIDTTDTSLLKKYSHLQ